MPHARWIRRPPTLLPFLAVAVLLAVAAAAAPPAGHWEGTLELPGQRLAMAVDLSGSAADGWSATIDLPAQGLQRFPLGEVRADASGASFKMPGIPGDPTFTGTFDDGLAVLSGTLTQSGQAFPFRLSRTGEAAAPAAAAAPVPAETAAALTGTWAGALVTPAGSARIVFHVKAAADGALAATMDSPDQGQSGLPVSRVRVDGGTIRFELDYAQAAWVGALGADGSSLDGSWEQAGAQLPLPLKRQGADPAAPATSAAPAEPPAPASPSEAPARPTHGAKAEAPFRAAAPESVGLKAAALAQLREHLEGLVDDDAIVGGEIAVIKNRRLVMHEAFGWKDREARVRLEPGALYCVRSMTKPITGTAVQLLIDEGQLSLDTRVGDLLPSFDDEKNGAITVRQLLEHSSGLPFTVVQAPLTKYRSPVDLAAEAAAAGPEFPPGTRFQYSDAGSDTLAGIVETVAGMPAARFVETRVLEPLGMTDTVTVLAEDDPRLPSIPAAYSGGTGSWTRHWSPADGRLFPLFFGSQGVYSTTLDYARFLALWMDGGRAGAQRLLSEDAIRRGLTPAHRMTEYPSGLPGLATWYGQQWMIWAPGDAVAGAPAGLPAVFGHGGSDGTQVWAWPAEDLIVLFFTQSRGTMVTFKLETLLQRLLVEGDVSQRAAALEPTAQELASYVGLYEERQLDHHVAAVTLHGGHLAVELPGLALLVFVPTAERDHFVSEAIEQLRIDFERDEQDRVTALVWHESEHSSRHERLVPDEAMPNAAEVVARMMRAHGTKKLARADGVRLSGTLTIEARGLAGTIEQLFSADGVRTETVIAGQRQLAGVTGDRAWSEHPLTGLREMEGAQLAQALLDQPARRWGDWEEAFDELTVVRRDVVDGDLAWIVWAKPADAPGSVRYVRVVDGRLVRTDGVMIVPGVGPVGVKARFEDFRQVGRLTLPFRIVLDAATPLIGRVVTQFDEGEVGVVVPDGAYEPPPPAS